MSNGFYRSDRVSLNKSEFEEMRRAIPITRISQSKVGELAH
jgi:hypothetical protein